MRVTLPVLRAALWSFHALARARRQLRESGLQELWLPPPPTLSDDAFRGVQATLRRRPATCLEQALVLQRWHAAHGRPQDVVIGVARREGTFRAHAWLDGDADGAGFRELMRFAAAP